LANVFPVWPERANIFLGYRPDRRVTSGYMDVVFYLNPRYDSGRTHPYHPNRARFFLVVEEPLEQNRAEVPFRGVG
jgi:hypothetical protein